MKLFFKSLTYLLILCLIIFYASYLHAQNENKLPKIRIKYHKKYQYTSFNMREMCLGGCIQKGGNTNSMKLQIEGKKYDDGTINFYFTFYVFHSKPYFDIGTEKSDSLTLTINGKDYKWKPFYSTERVLTENGKEVSNSPSKYFTSATYIIEFPEFKKMIGTDKVIIKKYGAVTPTDFYFTEFNIEAIKKLYFLINQDSGN